LGTGGFFSGPTFSTLSWGKDTEDKSEEFCLGVGTIPEAGSSLSNFKSSSAFTEISDGEFAAITISVGWGLGSNDV
jgi:hypothetical protein